MVARNRAFRLRASIALAIIAGAGLALWFLFRTEEFDNPDLGIIYWKYRWGQIYEQAADTNRDGALDFRARFGELLPQFGTHQPPEEMWEDRDFDGNFEIHAFLDQGVVRRVEIDDDNDGQTDRVLTDDEARSFFESFLPSADRILAKPK